MEKITLLEAMSLAEHYYRANIPFALEGPHGIGKSLGLQEMSNHLGVGFVDLRLTLFEETDLIGAPYKPDGGDHTAYTKPIWLSLIEASGKDKGLLCLEELNRCDALVRQPALQLIWDRRCSHWELPEGWLPVATWNPVDEGYETVDLDPALLSRLVVLKVRPDVDTWVKWARENNIPKLLIDFITDNRDCLFNDPITPRTWAMAAKALQAFPEKPELLKPILRDIYPKFTQFTKLAHLPCPVNTLTTPVRAESTAKMLLNDPSLRYFYEGRMIEYLSECAGDTPHLKGLLKYLKTISPDEAMAFLERFKTHDKEATRNLSKAIEESFDVSLMKHIFGEVDEASSKRGGAKPSL